MEPDSYTLVLSPEVSGWGSKLSTYTVCDNWLGPVRSTIVGQSNPLPGIGPLWQGS